MRNNSDNNYPENYGQYHRHYQQDNRHGRGRQQEQQNRRDEFIRGDDEGYVQPHYRSEEHDRRPTDRYSRDDFYNSKYDISNYDGTPREEHYGHIGRGGEGYGDKVRHFPLDGDPYREERTHLRYNMGYNPNYDNPEEGDTYRNFDSRGNHGFRHDASYGSSDEFRDFGNDRYGESYDRSARNRNNKGYYR